MKPFPGHKVKPAGEAARPRKVTVERKKNPHRFRATADKDDLIEDEDGHQQNNLPVGILGPHQKSCSNSAIVTDSSAKEKNAFRNCLTIVAASRKSAAVECLAGQGALPSAATLVVLLRRCFENELAAAVLAPGVIVVARVNGTILTVADSVD